MVKKQAYIAGGLYFFHQEKQNWKAVIGSKQWPGAAESLLHGEWQKQEMRWMNDTKSAALPLILRRTYGGKEAELQGKMTVSLNCKWEVIISTSTVTEHFYVLL